MDSKLIQNNIFRVAAVLYGNNNYDISLRQVYKKVIEDALYQLPTEGVYVGYLAEYIDQNYSLLFTPEEIQNTLEDKRYQDCFEFVPFDDDKKYMLTKKRRLHFDNAPKKKTLPEFIEQYLDERGVDGSKGECIMVFLYNMFTSNLDSFQRLLKTKKVNAAVAKGTLSTEDVEVINGFLDWNSEEKNVAIFDLSSYALEYCMISNHKDANFKLDDLSNKTFYLDTNIIYRAIGINGEDRKTRARLFLSKFKKLNCSIVVSKYTHKEFQETIKYYIKKLRKSETPAISSKVYVEYVTYDDIWKLYHNQKSQKYAYTVDSFNAYLQAEYSKICEDFEIEIEKDEEFECNEEELNSLAAQIKGLSDNKSLETALIDAYNVKWIESKRSGHEKTIFDSKNFMLSSDFGFCFWDSHYHSLDVPVVIQPSQWLSIILRYMDRTEDDFKSFVCFLNIKISETKLSNEEVHVILEGISEVTDNVEKQNFYLQSFINEDFKKGNVDLTSQQLKQLAKKSAERKLQKELLEEKAKIEGLKGELDDYKKTIAEQEQIKEDKDKLHQDELKQLQNRFDKEKQSMASESKMKDTLNEKLRSEIEGQKSTIEQKDKELDKYRRSEFRRKKIWPILWRLIISGALIFHIIWYFIVEETDHNYMASILSWVKSLDPERKTLVPGIVVSIIISAIVLGLLKKAWNIFKEKYSEEN